MLAQSLHCSPPRVVLIRRLGPPAHDLVVKQPLDERVGGEQLGRDELPELWRICSKLGRGQQLRRLMGDQILAVESCRIGSRSAMQLAEHCQSLDVCELEDELCRHTDTHKQASKRV